MVFIYLDNVLIFTHWWKWNIIVNTKVAVILSAAVADAGFLEGRFCYNNARKVRTKFLGHAHISSKPRPFSNIFERSFLLYLSIHSFSIEIFAKACWGEP